MTFLSPLMLVGLVAVSVPIIFHLLQRRKVRTIHWGAMRFLDMAFRKNRNRMRIEQLILLLVRCLVLVFLALAFARPRVSDAPAGLASLSRTDRLVVIDRSMSMGAIHEGITLLERAKEYALEYVGSLGASDRVAVLAIPSVESRRMVGFGAATERSEAFIRSLRPSSGRFSWDSFWETLEGMFDSRAEAPASLEVVILTDMQAATWAVERLVADHARWQKWTASGIWKVWELGEETENTAIVRAGLGSGVPVVGTVQELTVFLARYGGTGDRRVSVSLEGEGAPPEKSVTIPGSGTGQATFRMTPAQPGSLVYQVNIEPDPLPADDRLPVVLEASEEVKLVIVDGDRKSGRMMDDETIYMRLALEEDPDRPAAWSIRTLDVEAFDIEAVDSADLVILADVESLSEAIAGRLEDRVAEGTGLVCFLGDRSDPAFWSESRLGPGRLGDLRGGSRSEETCRNVVPVDPSLPIVAAQRDPSAFLTGGLVWGHWQLDPRDAAARGAQVVLQTSDNSPYMVKHSLGEGRIITVLGSADLGWNNLPSHEDFVPWMREMARAALGSGVGRWNRRLGDTVPVPMMEEWITAERIEARYPSGSRLALNPHQGEGGRWDVRVPLTETGITRICVDGREVQSIAVRADAVESDLRRTDSESVSRKLPKVLFSGQEELTVATGKGGVDFWSFFLWSVLAMAIAETVLARRAGLAR